MNIIFLLKCLIKTACHHSETYTLIKLRQYMINKLETQDQFIIAYFHGDQVYIHLIHTHIYTHTLIHTHIYIYNNVTSM